MTLTASQSARLPMGTVYDGLPPQLHDAAPSGFLGRSYARRHSDLGLPSNPSNWSDHHVLRALSHRGEDLPGNLVIGRESFNRFQNLAHRDVEIADFAELAQGALAGDHAGSSAGGEQPKFTALVKGRHSIVKFANDATDNGRRWQDLLLLEHLALQTLSEAGIAAAPTQIVDLPGLRCLVIDRFDRVGVHGRRAVVSLAALGGVAQNTWSDAATSMAKRDEIDPSSAREIALLDAYGALIANTDRHAYNMLFFSEDGSLSVAPAFDQLPMAYAPPASGYFRNSTTGQPRPTVATLEVWEDARSLAHTFWQRAKALRLSDAMRAIVREHAAR